jgi:hypothetical protein
VFRPRRPRKTCTCYKQTVPTGSGIGRGSSSTLGVVSTLGGTWPGLERRPGRKDLHPREDASTAPADVLGKLQPPLPHLLGLGSRQLPGQRSLFSSQLRLCPCQRCCLRLRLIAEQPRVLKTEQERPRAARPTEPRDSYTSGIRIPHSSPSAKGNSRSVKWFG